MQSPSPQLKWEVLRAPAGAGKTRTLINKLMTAINSYYKKHQKFPHIAVSTFTRKAVGEIKERLMTTAIKSANSELINYITCSPALQISTLHGLFHSFLQRYGYHIGISPGFQIMDEEQDQKLFKTVLKTELLENKISSSLLNHYSFSEIQDIVKNLLRHKQYNLNSQPARPEDLQSDKEKETFIKVSEDLDILAEKSLKNLIQKKKEQSQLTYNDLEIMTLEVLKKNIKPKLQDFWFLDEYQDTSPIQDEILKYLTAGQPVFMVGDPQQSIYQFRGANYTLFLEKLKTAESVKKYTKNYRSSPGLIDFFNNFFSSSPSFSSLFTKMETEKKPLSKSTGAVQFIPVDSKKKSEEQNQKVFEKIKQMLSQGISLKDTAVLSRKNKTLFQTALYLKKENLPVQLYSSEAFQNKPEVRDGLFILNFLLSPHNDENLVGLLRMPELRIPDNTLIKWTSQKNEESLWSFCLKQEKQNKIIIKLNNFLNHSFRQGLVHTFEEMIKDLGLLDLAHYQDPTGLREAHLWKIIYQLRAYESQGADSLLAFPRSALNRDSQKGHNAVSAIEPEGLQMMTIHAAKGLEFDHVLLIDDFSSLSRGKGGEFFTAGGPARSRWALSARLGSEDKRIKSSFQKQLGQEDKEQTLEEMDRLVYTALTRAKKTITIIYELNGLFTKRFPHFNKKT